jgi:hypothetical protein
VTFHFADLTTGQRYSKRRYPYVTDVSSAEWIVEAPSECPESGGENECTLIPLAHIGSAAFDRATALSGYYRRPAGSDFWSTTTLTLKEDLGTFPTLYNNERETVSSGALIKGVPSPAGSDGSFSVTVTEKGGEEAATEIPSFPGAGRP